MDGTLYQDLASQRDHQTLQHYQKAPTGQGTHTVPIAPETKLATIVHDSHLLVNDHHHQGVKALAPSFKLSVLAN
nr:gamma-glutamyl-gamma-aminobutyrate hydrolase family protein [Lentilactobacillus fungorum]